MRWSTTTTIGDWRVLIVEEPAGHERNLHGPEVFAGDRTDVDVDELLPCRRIAPFDRDRSPGKHLAERERRHTTRGGDAGIGGVDPELRYVS